MGKQFEDIKLLSSLNYPTRREMRELIYLQEQVIKGLFKECNIVLYRNRHGYPIEHNRVANKDSQDLIINEILSRMED